MAQVFQLQEEAGVKATKSGGSKRPTESLTKSEGSTANKIKKDRVRKCKRLNEIRQQMGMQAIACT